MNIKAILPPARSIRPTHLRLGNSLVVAPSDDLAVKYNWLKSSNRNTEMGALAWNNRRVMILSPGTYTPTDKLTLDTSFVDITSLNPFDPASVVITRDSIDDYIIEQTCANINLSGFYALATPNTKAALCINYVNEGTNAVTASSTGGHGKGYTSVQATDIGKDIRAGDDIWLYKSAAIAGAWYKVKYVNNANDVEVEANLSKTTSVTYEIIPQNSTYQQLILDESTGVTSPAVLQSKSGLYGLSNIGGYWKQIKLGNFAGGVFEYHQTRAIMEFITGGYQCLGIDGAGVDISGTIRHSTFGDYSIGGCGIWGCNISGLVEYCTAGNNSFALGRKISGIVRYCQGGTNSFCGVSAAPITDATGTDAAKSVITKTGGFSSGAYYGQNKGRSGLTIYLSGTNCTAGYYEIESVDSADQITLTANASSGGAMSGLTIQPYLGQITGKAYNCISSGGDSFAKLNVSPHRVTGLVRNSYLNDVLVALP